MNGPKIPQTDSIEELARFWGTHDLADFKDELTEVQEPVFGRSTVVEIHLQLKEAAAVKRAAEIKGVEGADLIREWILEKLRIF